MKFKLLILVGFLSNYSYAIEQVNQGEVISASKINEVIQKLNEATSKIESLEKKILPVGSVVNSLLTLTQFQNKNGDCWRLMDGSSIAGSELASLASISNLPDAVTEGVFLRQAKNGRALGSYEADAFQGHYHSNSIRTDVFGSGDGPAITSTSGADEGFQTNGSNLYIREAITDGTNGSPRTAAETRPKNTAVNMFIKIKEQCNFN